MTAVVALDYVRRRCECTFTLAEERRNAIRAAGKLLGQFAGELSRQKSPRELRGWDDSFPGSWVIGGVYC